MWNYNLLNFMNYLTLMQNWQSSRQISYYKLQWRNPALSYIPKQ